MSVVVTCEKCGAENRLGQLLCRTCGAKLNLDKLEREMKEGLRRQKSMAWLARSFRLLLLFLMVIVLGGLCWPVPAGGDAPSPEGIQVVSARLTALRGAFERRNSKVERLEEADLNAYLRGRLIQPVAPEGTKLYLKDVRLNLVGDAIEVWLESGAGPLRLTYSTRVTLKRQLNGRIHVSAGTVRIGHVPMPGPLRDRTTRQMANVFSELKEEQGLLNRMSSIKVVDGALEITTM